MATRGVGGGRKRGRWKGLSKKLAAQVILERSAGGKAGAAESQDPGGPICRVLYRTAVVPRLRAQSGAPHRMTDFLDRH